ncbi:PIF1 helicase, partial [Acromyrmex charruanus]
MLNKIDGDEIVLIAEDVDCATAMKKRVHKILEDKDDKVSEIAGNKRVIAIKIGAKVMITKVDIKFEVFHKMVVHRKQFPLSLSYGITIHKSQGITCKNTTMDLEISVFSDQAHVGLSRVNPAYIKANSEAIVEYNRLRSVFKAQPQIHSSEKKGCEIHDCRWVIPHIIDDVQNYGCEEPESIITWKIYGLCNEDHVSYYVLM